MILSLLDNCELFLLFHIFIGNLYSNFENFMYEKIFQIHTISISSSEDINSLRSLSLSVFFINVFRRRNILDLCILRFVFSSSMIMFDSSSSNTYLSISITKRSKFCLKFYFILLILFHHVFLQTTDDRFHFPFL